MRFVSCDEKNRSCETEISEISAQLGSKWLPEKTKMSYFLLYTSVWPETTHDALQVWLGEKEIHCVSFGEKISRN